MNPNTIIWLISCPFQVYNFETHPHQHVLEVVQKTGSIVALQKRDYRPQKCSYRI